MDIIKELGDSRLYNLHSHTQFCDGKARMEEFARAAAEAGFTHYGYSPHSPICIASSCNMAESDVPAYLAEVDRIKQSEWGDKVKFYASMEIDYLGDQWGPAIGYFQDLPLDYRIGSVHFTPNRHGELIDIDGPADDFTKKMHDHFSNDIRYVVEKYFEHEHNMLDAGGFDIIGHFDKIGHNGSHYADGLDHEDWYMDLVDGMIKHIAKSGVIVEINTKANKIHSRFFPDERHWQKLKEAGIPVIVNSDAHHPLLINADRDYPLEWFGK
ncbi:MAG: histidinol-phosphatase HisJ family protein [Muribaculaceae bacterium]|nr:histidinol-phosphatase HisJ family protein [Muribaculaceae bacterium]